MKKAIVVLMLILSTVALFAETYVQTIVLISVVKEVEPSFYLEVGHVENGYGYNTSKNEASIFSHNVKENVRASFGIWQDLSRYRGEVEITVSVSDLYWEGYHTNGLNIHGNTTPVLGRKGIAEVSGNSIVFNLGYSGTAVESGKVAYFSVEYNGDSALPKALYISYIQMVVEVK